MRDIRCVCDDWIANDPVSVTGECFNVELCYLYLFPTAGRNTEKQKEHNRGTKSYPLGHEGETEAHKHYTRSQEPSVQNVFELCGSSDFEDGVPPKIDPSCAHLT